MHTYMYMGSLYHVFTNKSMLRFAYYCRYYVYIHVVIERLLHDTFLLHVATKLRNHSLGRLTRTHQCEVKDTADV